jgi:DNA-binding transcriptional regulator LsrR (DeoR family)
MAEIREVIYQHHQGAGQRSIERSLGISRNSIRKYIAMAVEFGYTKAISNQEIESIAIAVQKRAWFRKPLF